MLPTHAHRTRPAAACRAALALGFVAALGGCLASAPHLPPPADGPRFLPEEVFAGRTTGRGTLSVRGRAPRAFRVESVGRAEGDAFVLDQTLSFDDGEVHERTWAMRPDGAGRTTATLTDAAGTVAAETVGSRFRLRYLLRRPGVVMEQWLDLLPDGQTVINEGTVTVLGVPIARLSEIITRAEPLAPARPAETGRGSGT